MRGLVSSTIDKAPPRAALTERPRGGRPEGPARAAVLLLHGIAEHSGRYQNVGDRFAAAGFDTVAIDHRGYGLSGGRRGHCDRWSQFSDDVADQLFEVRKLGLPTVLLGHSLGGLMATRFVVDDRPEPDLLVLSGPALGAQIPRRLRIAAPVLGRLLPNLEIKDEGDPSLLSSDPRVGELFYADPLRVPNPTARMGMEILRAISQARAGIERVTMPTLVVHGGDDALVPPEASEIFETLPNAERIVYPGLRHEVFNEPTGTEVIDRVVAWINERL